MALSSRPLHLHFKLWLEASGEGGFGPGHLELLELVERQGTLREAARQTGISYRHAWDMLAAAERVLGVALVQRQAGGPSGGSTHLTEAGLDLVAKWRHLCAEVDAYALLRFDELFSRYNAGGDA
jgi:molybdate transport repressor ModE-like protein